MAKQAKTGEGIKIITTNRKARHDYIVLDTYEAGLVLQGTEVKSLRNGRANLVDSYATVDRGEVHLHSMHISTYEHGSVYNHDPTRTRKLLLHKEEIRRLTGRVVERGLTLVPLKLYFKRGLAKVELALVKGKKQYDHRQTIAERDARRDAEREMKARF
mgnify:CR=1 FL=1